MRNVVRRSLSLVFIGLAIAACGGGAAREAATTEPATGGSEAPARAAVATTSGPDFAVSGDVPAAIAGWHAVTAYVLDYEIGTGYRSVRVLPANVEGCAAAYDFASDVAFSAAARYVAGASESMDMNTGGFTNADGSDLGPLWDGTMIFEATPEPGGTAHARLDARVQNWENVEGMTFFEVHATIDATVCPPVSQLPPP